METTSTGSRSRKASKRDGVCEILYVDERKVAAVLAAAPQADQIEHVAERFGVLADPTRIRLIHALSRAELCVCDLAKVAGRSMPATSQQLQLLRRSGVVKFRMDGKLAYYSLAQEWVRSALDEALQAFPAGARR